MILTSVDAQLRLGNLKIGRCRNFNITITKEALPTTRQGDLDRSFLTGLRSASGTFTLFYDPQDQGVRAVINEILSDSSVPLSDFRIYMNKKTGREIACSIVILQVTAGIDYGAAQTCEVTFNASGSLRGLF